MYRAPLDDMSPRPISPLRHSKHSAARAADISRILDPSYSSSSASSTVHAYQDRNGDLHDPDYRHFPIAHQPNSSKRHSSHLAARPRWELIDEDALDDEYDVGEYPTNGRTNTKRQRESSSFSSYSRPTYSPPSYNYSHQPQYYHCSNSPPHSATFDSDDTVFDEYEEFEHEAFVEKEQCNKEKQQRGVSHILKTTRTKFVTPPTNTRGHSKERKRWSTSSTTSDDNAILTVLSTSAPTDSPFSQPHHHQPPHASTHEYQEKEEMEREQRELRARDLEREDEGERWTPTCTQALRREWQAVSLRIRFSVFRAQRKMKNRIASFT